MQRDPTNDHSRQFPAIAEANTPFELLAFQAERWGEKPLFILPGAVAQLWRLTQTSWTYSQTLSEVQVLAEKYRQMGYGSGHRVALLFENRPHHFFHWLALNCLGASAVPLNPDYTEAEFAFALKHSGAALAVAHPASRVRVEAAARNAGIELWDGNLLPSPARPIVRPAEPADQRECVLAYTSGTTGKPKGCLLSNRYFLSWGDWYVAQEGRIALRPGEERLLTPLPTFHVNAMGNSFIGMLASGGAQVIVDRFHPRSFLAMARETGATCFHYLGVMPAILLALPETGEDRSHSLRFGLGGGVHPDHHEKFETRFGVPLLEGWTMTETGGAGLLCASTEPRQVGMRCLGRPDRPGPAFEFRIVGEDGQDTPQGEGGEFLIRAAGDDHHRGFFSGYLNDEAATATAWEGGWFHTGDVIREDEEGYLYFADRKKDIIRRSGENISAAEVESVLAAHPSIAQVAVVPRIDPLREEEVTAIIVKRGDDRTVEDVANSIFQHAAAQLAYYKLPGVVLFVDELPTTSTGKLQKIALKAIANRPPPGTIEFDFRNEKQAQRKKPGAHGTSAT